MADSLSRDDRAAPGGRRALLPSGTSAKRGVAGSRAVFAPLPDTPVPGRAERAYMLLSGIFLGALVLTNLIAGKFFSFLGLPLSCGVIAYPVTFLATDLISEVYGRRRATQVVKVGFVVSVFVAIVIFVANHAPIAETSYVDQQAFARVFGLTPGIVLGSMVAYLSAQFMDVLVFEFWRNLTGGRHLWLRNNGSTILSQLLDTVLVVTIALIVWPVIDLDPSTEPISRTTWWQIIVGQYLFKAGMALMDTPFFYLGTRWMLAWIEADPQRSVHRADRIDF